MKNTNTKLQTTKRIAIITSLLIALVVSGTTLPGCKKSDSLPSDWKSSKYITLNNAMRTLWGDHMQFTYATVDAFFKNSSSLQPTLNRLLQNQKDIGAAIVPYYGQAAGDTLTRMLTTHIQQAVPVLQAAQAGNQPALDKALADWYANAKEIAHFLSTANPNNWPASTTEHMMEMHITQTTTYATDMLNGDYNKAITDYQLAYEHMMMMADVLSDGIAKQFPEKFY